VQLCRAHHSEFDASTSPDFSASTPEATRTREQKSGLLMDFGGKQRMVSFSGKSEAPTVGQVATTIGLMALGPLGEVVHLGVEATELKGDHRRRQEAREAWIPVLLGRVNWTALLA
jgi:hypothetical protein